MNTYCLPEPRCLKGLDVLVGALPASDPVFARMDSAANTLLISFGLGIVLGTVGGALVWPAHRVAGALIGGLIVGPVVGGTVGALVAKSQVKGALK